MIEDRLKNREIPYDIEEPITLERISQDVRYRIIDMIPISYRPLDVIVMTGEYGLISIHEEMEAMYSSVVNLEEQSAMVIKEHAYTYQTALCKFTVLHNPQLDNTRLHGIKLPNSHYPISSAVIHVFFAGYPIITYQPYNISMDHGEEQ